MRKLASVQKIEWVRPIEGKDRIALFGILGWSVICQKTIGEVGDNVVYCEIDSVLPEKEEFEFLRSKKFHIKTMKMSGVISQGICFPMSILPERKQGYKVGDDVTDIIGVTEFTEVVDDPVVPGQKSTKKKNPLMRFALYRRLLVTNIRKIPFLPNTSARQTKQEFSLHLGYLRTRKINGLLPKRLTELPVLSFS